jgi:Mrp family chromosome partitioning ATPase
MTNTAVFRVAASVIKNMMTNRASIMSGTLWRLQSCYLYLLMPTLLVLLPGKGTSSESSELLSSPRMLKLFKELKSRYESRIIIYDLPPLLNVDDAQVILPNIDSTILIVENGKNTESEVQNSLRLLKSLILRCLI